MLCSEQGCTHFSKVYEPPQNSTRQRSHMKQVPPDDPQVPPDDPRPLAATEQNLEATPI